MNSPTVLGREGSWAGVLTAAGGLAGGVMHAQQPPRTSAPSPGSTAQRMKGPNMMRSLCDCIRELAPCAQYWTCLSFIQSAVVLGGGGSLGFIHELNHEPELFAGCFCFEA